VLRWCGVRCVALRWSELGCVELLGFALRSFVLS
jgi:hypothetical protein